MFSLAIIKVRYGPISPKLPSVDCSDAQDTLAIQPGYFSVAPETAIKQELNKKYANKVLHDVGLGICVFDIAKVGEGKVRYGDGCYWYQGR
jgi:DNA-directed RNA polymerase subunit E'/Rpb7